MFVKQMAKLHERIDFLSEILERHNLLENALS